MKNSFIIPQIFFYLILLSGLKYNESESAVMFSLFPLGFIISIYTMIKNKKIDLSLLLLQVIYIFFSIYCIFGFPKILAKLTLLTHSPAYRTFIAIGFIDILLLIRGMALNKYTPSTIFIILISTCIPLILISSSKIVLFNYLTPLMLIIMYILLSTLFYFALTFNKKISKICFAIEILIIMFLTGGKVNPIVKGINMIYDSPVIKAIQTINNDQDGKWLVLDNCGFMPNYILASGVPVINSTNVYPTLERWYKLDPEKKYENIYNRFAHINIELQNTNSQILEKFILIQPDLFKVYLTNEDLKTLDITYVISSNPLDSYNNNILKFELISKCQKYYIYKIT